MKLILKRPHRHAGRDLVAGERIDVPEAVAAFLRERRIAEPAPGRPRKPEASESTTKGD